MFVTTFYSYKGGVGRSLALANVAAELAGRDRSVLIADFDLEAPGVTSFDFGGDMAQAVEGRGIVDFITSWLDDNRSPDVRDYVYRCDDGESGGAGGTIWVMPAGRQDAAYGPRLSKIDFGDLYRNHDGFLLFEDLKAQWRDELGVDYVLIDSRTGHTDIGGVCTRQLPDLVVFVFWPNAQNLNGLSLILDEMRQEEGADTAVRKLFVPSNLPTLDDEDGLLQKQLATFRGRLDYTVGQEVQVQNYPSLDLLGQQLFTRERPKSRLGRQYRALADAVQRQNLTDEQGVRLHLERLLQPARVRSAAHPRGSARPGTEPEHERVDALSKKEWKDPEIIRILARLGVEEGDYPTAIGLIERLVTRGDDRLPDHLLMAEAAISARQSIDARKTVGRLLDDPDASQRHVLAAINLLVDDPTVRTEVGPSLADRPAIRRLTLRQLVRVCESVSSDPLATRLVAGVVRTLLVGATAIRDEAHQEDAAIELSLPLIGAGFFEEAEAILTNKAPSERKTAQRRAFNLAMAIWGRTGSPSKDLLLEVINIHDAEDRSDDPWLERANYSQCLSLSCACLGDPVRARTFADAARQAIELIPKDFSCWSYLARGQAAFVADIDEMRSWISTGAPLPKFMVRAAGISGQPASVAHDEPPAQ